MNAHPAEKPAVLRFLVPGTFWDDHWERSPCEDIEVGMCKPLKRSGRQVLIEGDKVQVECLRADAQATADQTPTPANKALVRSAQATLVALTKPLKD